MGPEKVLAVCHIRLLDLLKLPERRKDQWFVLLHPADKRSTEDEKQLDATLAWMEQMRKMGGGLFLDNFSSVSRAFSS